MIDALLLRPVTRGFPVPHHYLAMKGMHAMAVSGTAVGVLVAALPDIGYITGAITAIGFATIGVYGYFQNRKLKAYRDAKAAEREDRNEQERDKIAIEKLRNQELAPMLTSQLNELSRQLAASREENRKLTAKAVETLSGKLDTAQVQSKQAQASLDRAEAKSDAGPDVAVVNVVVNPPDPGKP